MVQNKRQAQDYSHSYDLLVQILPVLGLENFPLDGKMLLDISYSIAHVQVSFSVAAVSSR